MNSVTKTVLIIVITLVILLPVSLFYGFKISPISWQLQEPVNHDSGLVLKGYDAVAYFNDGRAIKGDPGKGLKWDNHIWYFSSDANKLMFKTFPEKFVPRYGGYCAGAVAAGFTADINPAIWHIEDGKLYLFFDEDSKSDFVDKISSGVINSADAEWLNQ